jgi:hypothetical protein
MPSDTSTIAASPHGGAPADQRADSGATERSTAFALRACGVIMGASLFLQRFAVPAGDVKVQVASIVTIAVVLWGLAVHRLRLSISSFMMFLLLLGIVLATYLVNAQLVLRTGVRLSHISMIHFLGLFALFSFRFARPVDQLKIFALYQDLITVVVLCGFAQFTLQFVGIEFFSFVPYVPIDYLVEPLYNVVIPISGSGAPYKANGVFLVEPSVFSQVTAVAIAIEVTCFRRMSRLLLLFGGLLIAVSGTGMIVLAVFGALFLFNPRNARPSEILGLVMAVAIAALAVYLVFPEIFERMLSRVDEFEAQGSSGHQRFTSIWTGITYAYERFPDFLVWGIGPGSAEALAGERLIGINTLTKVAIEYGLIAFVVWLVYHVAAVWNRHLVAIVLPALVFFWTGGNYQQFGPPICLIVGLLALNPDRGFTPAAARAARSG